MPVNVLLVDDQASRRLTYRAILEPLGERLFDAVSGEDALRLLMQHEFVVILLDVNMPGMDGFETATMIHQHPRFEKTPIIFVTAVNIDDMDRLRGYKLGAVDYVLVPVIPEILRSKVMVLCELARKGRDLKRANLALAEANEALRLEKSRELAMLNASLKTANERLEERNDALFQEVEERRRIETKLRDVDRRKDEFLATLAHELRNPLAPLQNTLMIHARTGERLPPELVEMMQRQVHQLVRLIDDLPDVARISQGKINLQFKNIPLKDVVLPAIEAAKPLIDSRGHAFHIAMPEEDIHLKADAERLTQVFSNLLNNAAKYTEPGGEIRFELTVVDDELRAVVSDSGLGMDADEIDRVFDMFSQLERGSIHSQGGLGLGLTLVRELVGMHGGVVKASSGGRGKGSEFSIRLPVLAATSEVQDEPEARAPLNTPPARKTVLVVDDNRDAADSLAMMIRMLGHDAQALYDPTTVEAAVIAQRPDIIFTDIGMPEMDGRTLAARLRQLPGGEAIVLVAVSGWGQAQDKRMSIDAGFDQHLVKPPQFESIQAICSVAREEAKS